MTHTISMHAHELLDLALDDTLTAPIAATPAEDTKPYPLSMANDGERVQIRSLQGGKGLVMRLTELGLNQGTELRVIQRQGAGLVVARGETRIALGGGMATKILVTGLGR